MHENEYTQSRLEPELAGTKSPLEQLPSGNDPAYLPYTRYWDWGAFLLNCFWLPFFRMDATSIVLFVFNILFCGIPSLFACFYLGKNGAEIAWRYRRFDNVEQYKAVLAAWKKWGIIIHTLVILMLIGLLVGFYFLTDWLVNDILPQLNLPPM